MPDWGWLVGVGVVAAVAAVAALFHRLRMPVVGPLFRFELVRLARRGVLPRLRVGLALLFLLGLLVTYLRTFPDTDLAALLFGGTEESDQNRLQAFGETFLIAFLVVQQAAVLLLTPVYAGGAIAEEKERGGMDFLLTTPLTRWELVVGKLAARLTFVLGVLAVGVPVLLLTLLFGGVDPNRLLAGSAVAAVSAVAVGTFAAMLSVLRHTLRDVLLWCYGLIAALGVFGFCCGGFGTAAGMLSPVSAIWQLIQVWTGEPPLVDPTWSMVGMFACIHLALSGLFLLAALSGVRTRLRDEPSQVLVEPDPEPPPAAPPDEPPMPEWYQVRVRAAFEGGEPPPQYVRGRSFVVQRLTDADDPFVWKERFFAGRLPLVEARWLTMAFGCGVTAFLFLLCAGLFLGVSLSLSRQEWIGEPVNAVARVFLIAAVLAVPAVGVRTAVSVTEERAKQTLVSLLTLPVPRVNVLWAKVRGALLRTKWLFAGVVVALVLGLVTGGLHPVAAVGTAALFAGYTAFAAALGLWLSVRGGSSVRAVLIYAAVVLVTLIGPALFGTLVDAAAGVGGAWSDRFDLFSPPVAVWHATDLLLNGDRLTGSRGDGWPWAVLLVAAVYGAAGWALWKMAARRFEDEGRK